MEGEEVLADGKAVNSLFEEDGTKARVKSTQTFLTRNLAEATDEPACKRGL